MFDRNSIFNNSIQFMILMIWILSILKLSGITYKMVLEILKNIYEFYKK